MTEQRTSVPRDPRLESEPLETVARRYYRASAAGSTRTLWIVIGGLACVGLTGGFIWAYGGAGMSPSRLPGLLVLLGGALGVGLLAGAAPPPMSGRRAIVVSAAAIASVPVVISALMAVFGTGGDRAWGLELLGLTGLGGAVMVVLTAAGYAFIRSTRPRAVLDGIADPVAADVLTRVKVELDRTVGIARQGPVVIRAADDAAGRAWLDLGTRQLTAAGYVEIRRERVTVQLAPDVRRIAFTTPEPPPPVHTIEVAFDASGPTADILAVPRSQPLPLPSGRPRAGTSPSVDPATVPEPGLAEEAERWLRTQAAQDADDHGATADPDRLAGLVLGFAAVEALVAQVVASFALGSDPDPFQLTVGIVLVAPLPAAVGAVGGYRRGVRSWPMAVVPVIAVLTILFAIGLGESPGEALGLLALAGAVLTLPWAIGWMLGLAVRGARRGPAHPR